MDKNIVVQCFKEVDYGTFTRVYNICDGVIIDIDKGPVFWYGGTVLMIFIISCLVYIYKKRHLIFDL